MPVTRYEACTPNNTSMPPFQKNEGAKPIVQHETNTLTI
jgi:hypothetical protein